MKPVAEDAFCLMRRKRATLADPSSAYGNLLQALKIVMNRWLTRNHHISTPLIVTHPHSHEDHT